MILLSISIALQIVAFSFPLIASITAPVINKLAVANNSDGAKIGIFGYCLESKCSSVGLHTKFSTIVTSKMLSDKDLDTLSPYLILCPITAGLTFISLVFTITTLLIYKNRQLSTIYWFAATCVSVFAFVTSAACCVIAVLMFYPHVTWLTWCLLPSATLNFASLILISISFKLLSSSPEMVSDDEGEKTHYLSGFPNESGFDDSHDAIFRPDIELPSMKSISFTQTQKEVGLSHSSSIYTSNDKNDLLAAETIITKDSNTQTLKVPDIINPYNQDTLSSFTNSKSNLLSTEVMPDLGYTENDKSYIDNRLQKHENFSSNSLSSNFTSISQRPINPEYFAGGLNQQKQPLGTNTQMNINQQRYGGYGHQQVQINQFQQQMAGIPNNSKGGHVSKPKPYMMISKPTNALNGPNNTRNIPYNKPIQGFQNNNYPNNSYSNNNYPNTGYSNNNYPNTGYSNNNYPNTGYSNNNYPNTGYSNNSYLTKKYANNSNFNNKPFPPQMNNQYWNTNQFSSQKMRPNNGYVPMSYKGKSKYPTVAASDLGNDGPYSGFR